MTQEHPVILERFANLRHESAVILETNVFDHAGGNRTIEFVGNIAIILQANFNRQPAAHILGIFLLLFGNGNTNHTASVIFRGEFREATPATADVEESHLGAQSELATNQIHFAALRLRQIRCAFKISARVLHRRIEHRLEKIVSEIVVPFYDRRGTLACLAIGEKRSGESENISPIQRNRFLELGATGAKTHLIERFAIPPAVHVGFTQTKGAINEDATKKSVVVHAYVPGTIPIYANIRGGKKISDDFASARDETLASRRLCVVEPLRFGIS